MLCAILWQMNIVRRHKVALNRERETRGTRIAVDVIDILLRGFTQSMTFEGMRHVYMYSFIP